MKKMKMKKFLIILFLISIGLHYKAQMNDENNVIKVDQLNETEFYSMHSKGWVVFEYSNGEKSIGNLSNKDYVLYLSINCKDEMQIPKYLIEFNNNYQDGTWAGVDFVSSARNNYKKTSISIDEKDYRDPFTNYQKAKFKEFQTTLKTGKLLIMKFYDEEYNPETGKDELKLNRELQFMLQNSNVLDVSTNCANEDSAPDSTEAISSEAINVE